MTIRDARPDDVPAIYSLVRELAEYERMLDDVESNEAMFERHLFGAEPVARALVADDDGEVVGFALWFPTFSTFLGRPGIWLEDLYVRPSARRNGHGRALLAALRAKTDGRVEWSVLDWNESAQDFYRTMGARPLDAWTTWRWGPPATG
ncbi:MAG: family N-acetyltransferase [Actinomycetia bacterium]|nr:family N-acetyltransferase [Actinomycetes bacterium]